MPLVIEAAQGYLPQFIRSYRMLLTPDGIHVMSHPTFRINYILEVFMSELISNDIV
jgi:hypothetical protein